MRLTAAGQILQPNDSRCRNLPFVIPRGDRPLHLQQQPLNSDGPHELPSVFFTPRRPAIRDPEATLKITPQSGQCCSVSHGQIVDAVSISERPVSVEDRAVPGHWEGALVFGSGNSRIATLIERQTPYVMLVKVGGKGTETVVNALIKNARKLPQELYKSLTWDRGKEMAAHKRFTIATDIQVFFCDPQSPWKRGSNENTNGLLRQYMPKGMDISDFSQLQLNAIARQLNERPRKTLGFHTPAEMFSESVAWTG